MTVHLHIDRVVLSDLELATTELQAMEEALREQLASSLAEHWEGAQIRRIDAAPVQIGQGGDGKAIGTAVGDALRTSLGRT